MMKKKGTQELFLNKKDHCTYGAQLNQIQTESNSTLHLVYYTFFFSFFFNLFIYFSYKASKPVHVATAVAGLTLR